MIKWIKLRIVDKDTNKIIDSPFIPKKKGGGIDIFRLTSGKKHKSSSFSLS